MIYNMSNETQPTPSAVYGITKGSVTYSGSPGSSGVWCPCGGQSPMMILGYYDNGSSNWLFGQDRINTPAYQQTNLTTIDSATRNQFVSGPGQGAATNELGKTTAGIQTGLARGTSGTCKYRILYLE